MSSMIEIFYTFPVYIELSVYLTFYTETESAFRPQDDSYIMDTAMTVYPRCIYFYVPEFQRHQS